MTIIISISFNLASTISDNLFSTSIFTIPHPYNLMSSIKIGPHPNLFEKHIESTKSLEIGAKESVLKPSHLRLQITVSNFYRVRRALFSTMAALPFCT